MDKLRVASIGCGPRGHVHMSAMRNSGAVELVAACDLHEDKLRAVGERHLIPSLYTGLSEMIRHERPDLVDIVTPPTIRVDIVEAAIGAGAKNILIEKPIALRPSESRRLAELGRRCFIAVNTQYPWMPHWQRFWGLIRGGALGEIRTIRCSTRTNVLEQGPHVIDLALRAAAAGGLPGPQWVLAAAAGVERFGDTPVPADLAATIGLGPARLLWNQGPSAPEVPGEKSFWYHIQVEITGSRGRLWVSLNQGWELWLEGRPVERGDTAWPRDDAAAQAAMYVQLRDAIRADSLRTAAADFPTRIEVAARNSDVIFACYASALGNGRVLLPATVDDWVVDQLPVLGAFTAAPA
jgi:UDP-N-acetyl-2-amino-2-deoxyglucuronate dehydrogenase